MPIPVLSALILIFVIWLKYEIKKTTNLSHKSKNNFWQNEKNSNLTRRVDISNLDYITIQLDRLPMVDHADETINSYRDTILKLSDKKILNLTGFTNTELKYLYGAANINILSEYDNNYTILVSFLHKWAERLYVQGFVEDAATVLEYAIFCNTDVSKSYKLLATIYKSQDTPEKIDELIANISKTKVLQRDRITNELIAIKCSKGSQLPMN